MGRGYGSDGKTRHSPSGNLTFTNFLLLAFVFVYNLGEKLQECSRHRIESTTFFYDPEIDCGLIGSKISLHELDDLHVTLGMRLLWNCQHKIGK